MLKLTSIIILLFMIGFCGKSIQLDDASEEVPEKKRQIAEDLNSERKENRINTARILADLQDTESIKPALEDQLKDETDPDVILAIHYALAAHGNKESLRQLIKSLDRKSHDALIYLKKVTDQKFGSDQKKWIAWFENTSITKYQQQTKQKRLQKNRTSSFYRFAPLYEKLALSELEIVYDDGRVQSAGSQLTKAEKDLLNEMPTYKAWILYSEAVRTLQDKGDRSKAAKQFRKIVDEYQNTLYAEDAEELADLLEKMTEEDSQWQEPEKPQDLKTSERIKYYIYHLRNTIAYQNCQPGFCNLFTQNIPIKQPFNAAKELKEIGIPAIPELLKLLDDRRPIRAVGYWRDYYPQRIILRYQDAAIQILNNIFPAPLYQSGNIGIYLSNADPKEIKQLQEKLRSWWQANKGKSETELKWSLIDMLPVYSAVKVMESLAEITTEKPKVLERLKDMYQKADWLNRPTITELAAKLGDVSNVGEIIRNQQDGRYEKDYLNHHDAAASYYARESAKRLFQKYAKLLGLKN